MVNIVFEFVYFSRLTTLDADNAAAKQVNWFLNLVSP